MQYPRKLFLHRVKIGRGNVPLCSEFCNPSVLEIKYKSRTDTYSQAHPTPVIRTEYW